MTFYDITIETIPFLLIAMVLFFFSKKLYKDGVCRYIQYYIVVALLTEVVSRILINSGCKNLFLLNVFVFFQFILFSLFFFNLFENSKIRTLVKVVAVVVFVGLITQFWFDNSVFMGYNPLGYLITMLPIIVYGLFAIFRAVVFNKLNDYLLISFGLVMYLSSSLIVFLSTTLLSKLSLFQFNNIYILNNITYIIFLTLIFINIWKLPSLKLMR